MITQARTRGHDSDPCENRLIPSVVDIMTPSPSPSSGDTGTVLCCGLCKIKMIKRNFFRGLRFRLSRPRASIRKSDHENAECSRAYHQRHGARDALETDLRDKTYLGVSPVSPSGSAVTTSGQCNVHCRKSSVLSFGDVDTREVHRMMKFINRNKVVMLCLQQDHMRTSYHGQISSICKFRYKHFHKISFFLPSAKLIGERGDSTQPSPVPTVQTTQITDRHST